MTIMTRVSIILRPIVRARKKKTIFQYQTIIKECDNVFPGYSDLWEAYRNFFLLCSGNDWGFELSTHKFCRNNPKGQIKHDGSISGFRPKDQKTKPQQPQQNKTKQHRHGASNTDNISQP